MDLVLSRTDLVTAYTAKQENKSIFVGRQTRRFTGIEIRGGKISVAQTISVLSELKEFEKKQEFKLDKAKKHMEEAISKAQKDNVEKLEQAKKKALQEKQNLVEDSKKNVATEVRTVVEDYSKKEKELVKKFEKNLDKTVQAVFEELLK